MKPFLVLVAEGDPVLRRRLASGLERNGFSVLTAEHGAGAVELLAREPVDVVLMDAALRGLDGMEAVARIRAADHERSTVPIVMLSTYRVGAWRSGNLLRDVDGFVAKPVDEAEMLTSLRRCLCARIPHPEGCARRSREARAG